MSNEFKSKYHSDLLRSSQYVVREAEAKALLIRNLRKYYIFVREGDPEYVSKQGIIEGHPNVRFDYSLWYYDTLLLGFVEVTGDVEDSQYIYILSEKVDKARYAKVPVWFLYFKDKMRKRFIIRAPFVVRYGKLVKWLENENPYWQVPIQHCKSFREWVYWFGEVVKYINLGMWEEIRRKLIEW